MPPIYQPCINHKSPWYLKSSPHFRTAPGLWPSPWPERAKVPPSAARRERTPPRSAAPSAAAAAGARWTPAPPAAPRSVEGVIPNRNRGVFHGLLMGFKHHKWWFHVFFFFPMNTWGCNTMVSTWTNWVWLGNGFRNGMIASKGSPKQSQDYWIRS